MKKKLSSCRSPMSAIAMMSYVLVTIVLAVVISCSGVQCDSPMHHDATGALLDGAHHGPVPPAPLSNSLPGWYGLLPPSPPFAGTLAEDGP
ncbi:hypothetical protein BS78_K087800 [Paspalum vaginatum]|uniref:Uncharacterized protein n=1 Tax=Paspalum vaginatum TaxID=158149 RepID=A0A9W8CEQ6_9POAL|nr:hypothetical protein BS78_K087800 [Paspalum vaginatum]